MEAWQLAELDLFIDPIWAWEMVKRHGHEMTPKGIHDMTMLATGDVLLAERAWARAVDEQMKRTKPGE